MDIIKHDSCKYIYFSSAAVYGSPKKMPISEIDTINPVSPYGWHKYYGEQMCKEFASLYKVQTASLRLFSVFGPGQRKMLFYDLFNKTSAALDSIELQGSGNDSRDFIYISDVVLAVEVILKMAPMQGECYNVGSGIERQIKDVANAFVAIAAPEKKINFNGNSIPGYPSNWKADMTLMESIGFRAQTGFEQGIKQTIAWLKENA
ncbi:MAG: NAD-dependent epimerase/dehydratase family protein [Ferruginibacter sp.]